MSSRRSKVVFPSEIWRPVSMAREMSQNERNAAVLRTTRAIPNAILVFVGRKIGMGLAASYSIRDFERALQPMLASRLRTNTAQMFTRSVAKEGNGLSSLAILLE